MGLGVVVVDKAVHSEALVVRHAVAVTDADAAVRDAEAAWRRKVEGQRVVEAVRVLVGAFEEVHTHGGRVLAISVGTAVLIVGVAVVPAESALDVASDVVVRQPSSATTHPK